MELRNRFQLLKEEELRDEEGCSDVELEKKNNTAAKKVLGYKKKKVKP